MLHAKCVPYSLLFPQGRAATRQCGNPKGTWVHRARRTWQVILYSSGARGESSGGGGLVGVDAVGATRQVDN